MAGEIPKVPKQFALFANDDLAGVEYNPNVFDINPPGHAFSNPFQQQGMQQGGMPDPNMLQQLGGMGAMGGQMGAPMMGGSPFMQGGGQQPQQMPMGGQPPMGPQQPMMQPPPGAAAQSQGPIARMKSMLENAYQSDPQQYMMMMAALTQSATNPGLAMQMGQGAINSQRETELKEKQIDATRSNREQAQKDREDSRFDNRADKLHQRGRYEEGWLPPEGITPENIDKVNNDLTTKMASSATTKAGNEWLSDRMRKGLVFDHEGNAIPLPAPYEDIPEVKEQYDFMVNNLKRYEDERKVELERATAIYDARLKRWKALAAETESKEDRWAINAAISMYTNQWRAETAKEKAVFDKMLRTDIDIYNKLPEHTRLAGTLQNSSQDILRRVQNMIVDSGASTKLMRLMFGGIDSGAGRKKRSEGPSASQDALLKKLSDLGI